MKARLPGALGPISDAKLAEFWSKVDRSGECWVWTGTLSRGYGYLYLPGNRQVRAHRFSFYLATGEEPEVVRHCCDNPPCVRPDHLLAGIQADNVTDAAERRRYVGNYKLDSPDGRAVLPWKTRLEVGQKRCPRCLRTLSLADFNRNRRERDGLEFICRDCKRHAKGAA